MSKTNHIVIDGKDKCFRCLNCGTTEGIQMPIAVDKWLEDGELFIAAHRNCEKQEPTAQQVEPNLP